MRTAQPARGAFVANLLFDLDHFKLVNDTWGHLVGDECLKKVGGVARAALHRTTDIAARYGGEEFACILPETNVQGALHVAKPSVRASPRSQCPMPAPCHRELRGLHRCLPSRYSADRSYRHSGPGPLPSQERRA